MHLSPDQVIFWQWGWVKLNLTIVTTWVLMALITGLSCLATRGLGRTVREDGAVSHWRSAVEWVISLVLQQIVEVGLPRSEKYLVFIGTLFVLVATASLCTVLPGYEPPTGSLSTTTALALCVFFAVPYFGIREQGMWRYLRNYLQPAPIMLPFNIVSELSRTLALAVRLFGNMMSGGMILGILLMVTPLFFPVALKLLGLLTGMVQAYIFSILATVYIAAAVGSHETEKAVITKG
ncbi:MAG: F0F1 ATP synthase subunit A [Betaproteobacteria bacterium]|nr:F0F1 ATP synthase subunit A [Betaproteobacteria bacterium]